MPLRPLREPIEPPQFNLARGTATVTTPPPFSFENVTMRVFPLRANFLTLSNLIDQYLNVAPQFAYFRPSMPYVMLSVVNYGKMGLDAGNLGWTSQNEVLFSIPLDWYEPNEDGELVYKAAAQVSPFIFVDNEGSQVGGREVFGWPKVQGWFTRDVDAWAENPRNNRRLLSVSSHVFHELYAGDRPEPEELVRIEEEPAPSFTQFPPDPESALNPMVGLTNAMAAWSKIWMNGVADLARAPAQGYAPFDRQAMPDLIEGALGNMRSFVENVQANTINLKQFRDAEQPFEICYQAITNARMDVTQLRRGGMLGDLALLRGDPSGGFRVHVQHYDSQPIVETLGLTAEPGGTDHTILKPILPFWCQLDLRYLTGENLCWRTKDLHWRDREKEWVPEPGEEDTETAHLTAHAYNTTGSAGFQVATGPFRFPGATFRVLPLLADPERLTALCDAYLNVDNETGHRNEIVRFEPWGSYVYMTVTSIDKMSSETNDIGFWGNRQVEFIVPVRWYEEAPDGGERLMSAGFFSPFMFADGRIQTTTGREVNGWPTVAASIDSPHHPWLAEQGPVATETPLLELKTDVFEALGMGQENEWRTLIEVREGDSVPTGDTDEWNHIAETWGKEVKADLQGMADRARDGDDFDVLQMVALELLGNDLPFNQISLKQFRDCEQPTRSCYQSIVNCHSVIERVHDLREIEKPLHVRMHRFPTQPIVDMLGLKVKRRELDEEGTVEILQPMRSFYLRVDLKVELGENICWRAGSERWEAAQDLGKNDTYLTNGVAKAVGRPVLEQVAENPHRIRNTIQEWQSGASEAERLDSAASLRAVASDVEPQAVIHALLSTEMEHSGNPRWWQELVRRGLVAEHGRRLWDMPIQRLPYFVMRRDCVGTAHRQLFPEHECVENLTELFELDDDGNARENTGYWSPRPEFGPRPKPETN